MPTSLHKKNDDEIIVLDSVVTGLIGATRVRLGETEVELGATNIASSVTTGVRIQVRGRQIGGVVHANIARLLGATERIEYVVEGPITSIMGSTLFVRGERINIANAAYSGCTAANLASGRTVMIRAAAGAGQLEVSSVTLR